MDRSFDTYARSPPSRRRDYDDTYRRNDRDRRDRRRSRSPQLDRYEPPPYRSRDEDRENRRDRRRSSPPPIDRYVPGQDSPSSSVLTNPLPDPMRLDIQVGFTWFAEWWRTEQRVKEDKEALKNGRRPNRVRGERETKEEREAERPKIQAAYDSYKENLQRTQAQTFVNSHKDEDWFRERYVDEVKVPFRKGLMQYRNILYHVWLDDFQAGVFDDFTLEGIYKSESNGMGGVLEKEEGEAAAATEVLGVGDLLPSKGGDLRDPSAQLPTLLIKTIAPTVTRASFESFAKEHLGEDDGGFKHLSLSDPNPLKKCHRMGWIILNPESSQPNSPIAHRPEPSRGDDGESMEDDIDGADEAMKADNPPISLTTSERALERINGKTIEDPVHGNFTVHCGVHRPPEAPRKKALWDLFSAPERVERDLELATRLVQKLDAERGAFGQDSAVFKIDEKVQQLARDGRLQPAQPSKPVPDLDMDAEEDEEDEGQVEDEEDTDDESLLLAKKKLDLLVDYLRRVYNFCFFCVFESDSVHELQRKCPGGHLRRPRASLTSAAKEIARASARGEEFPLKRKGPGDPGKETSTAEQGENNELGGSAEERKSQFTKPGSKNAQQLQRAFNWVKTFEDKILQLLEPENVNIKKIGGVPAEEGLEEELGKYVKQEDVNKFRCKVPECTKLFKGGEYLTEFIEHCTEHFKGVDFWRKHVEKRHPDHYSGLQQDIALVNTYVLDPAHIAPSRSDANSNGHFPLNSHAPTGTPRGFQLHHALSMGFPGAGAPGMAPGLYGSMGGGAMHMANWAGAAAGGHGVGPMRNMGNRSYGGLGNGFARGAGPYARPDGRGRQSSMSGGNMGMMTAGGRSGMEGGTLAMGPDEAVRGRTMRSYEDLDADKGGGTGELNY